MARVHFDLHFDESHLDDVVERLNGRDGPLSAEERQSLLHWCAESGANFPVDFMDLNTAEFDCRDSLAEHFGLPVYATGHDDPDLECYFSVPDFSTFKRIEDLFRQTNEGEMEAGRPFWLARNWVLCIEGQPDTPFDQWDEVTEAVFNGEEDI